MYLLALAATPLLALASTQAGVDPAGAEPESPQAQGGTSGLAGSGSGGAAGSGWDGVGGSGTAGAGGSAGRGGAYPLHATLPNQARLALATPTLQTTLRRNVQMENGSEQALGDPAGSSVVSALTADLMVTTNGSGGDEADRVGVARNPRDRAP